MDKQSAYNDEFYEKVEKFDWITEAEYWVEKNVPDGYIHTQLRVTNKYGEFILKIDEEGIMLTCTCGCIDSFDMNFHDVCTIEKEAKKLRNRERLFGGESDRAWKSYIESEDGELPFDVKGIEELFRELQSLNPNKEKRVESQLRNLGRNIDRVKRNIDDLDIEQRESFLEKLKDVLEN